MSFDKVQEIADQVGGKITDAGVLPDGSGFAIMSMPLPKRHWIYGGAIEGFEAPPMPFRMGGGEYAVISVFPQDPVKQPHLRMTKGEFAERIRAAGRYAVRSATMKGTEMDFDPDALIQNLVVGMLGYWTNDGLTNDEWANPKDWRDALKELPRESIAHMEPTSSSPESSAPASPTDRETP